MTQPTPAPAPAPAPTLESLQSQLNDLATTVGNRLSIVENALAETNYDSLNNSVIELQKITERMQDFLDNYRG